MDVSAMLRDMQVSVQRVLQWVLPLSVLVLIGWLCVFKVADTDFWWHVKAGQLMRESGSIIHTDPFAYTRETQPYLATHEWLAQIVLSLVFDIGGSTAIILFRMFLIIGSLAVLLLLDPKRAWINALFVGVGAASIRHAIADRPQLFTFFLFALLIVLLFRYLQEESARRRRRILFFLPVLILFWSNVHGAASVVGIGLIGFLFLEKLVPFFFTRSFLEKREVLWLFLALALSALALLLTPAGFGNITYLWSLGSDKTIQFISEWQPSPLAIYFSRSWFVWITAVVSLITVRKNVLFSTLVLLSIGYLSLTALRHEPLIIFAGLAVTFHQLAYAEWWHTFLDTLLKRKWVSVLVLLGCINFIALHLYRVGYDEGRQHQLYGTGTFEPGAHAFDFLEREGISGNGFNSYDIGAYLLYRGAPHRKVFLDGRNVDYGYDYIRKAVTAGTDTKEWNALDATYNFSYALIYYGVQKDTASLSYTDHLDKDPRWALVYLDDWCAVYLKKTPENQSIIEKYAYRALTPNSLSNRAIPSALSVQEFTALRAELGRVQIEDTESIKPILYDAMLSIMLQEYSRAAILLKDAERMQPHNYLVYDAMSTLASEQGDFRQAYEMFQKAIRASGFSFKSYDKAYVESLKEKARQTQ